MKIDFLSNMEKGWFIGPFLPNVAHSEDFEAAVKQYSKGDHEEHHHHKIATEYTIIVKGKAKMMGKTISEGEIVTITPGMTTDFLALEDCTTVVVKIPAVIGDKYLGFPEKN